MNRRFCVVVLATLFFVSPVSAFADVAVTLDFSGFSGELAKLSIAPFSSTEVDTIKSNIKTQLEAVYASYSLTFTSTDSTVTQMGTEEVVSFGTVGGAGVLGLAPLDWRNLFGGTSQVFTGNFDFSVTGGDDSGDSRATLIAELSTALAGTAAHELGHSLGLQHHDAYGDPAIVATGVDGGNNPTYASTGDVQNTHIEATGSTGITEAQRETARTLSTIEKAKLEFGTGLRPSVPSTIAEQGAAHGTSGTAQSISLTSLAISGLTAAVVTGSIGTGSEFDFYSFSAVAGQLLAAEVLSDARYVDDINSVLTLFDTNGTTVLATNNDIFYSGNSFNSTTMRETDSLLLNFTIPSTGTFFLRVSDSSTDTGNYDLFTTLSDAPSTAVPEPSSIVLTAMGFAGLVLGRRRLWSKNVTSIPA